MVQSQLKPRYSMPDFIELLGGVRAGAQRSDAHEGQADEGVVTNYRGAPGGVQGAFVPGLGSFAVALVSALLMAVGWRCLRRPGLA